MTFGDTGGTVRTRPPPSTSLLRPGIAMSGRDADAVEKVCNLTVRHQSGQFTHERDRIVRNAWIVPAGCIQPLLHLQLSVIAALPVVSGL